MSRLLAFAWRWKYTSLFLVLLTVLVATMVVASLPWWAYAWVAACVAWVLYRAAVYHD